MSPNLYSSNFSWSKIATNLHSVQILKSHKTFPPLVTNILHSDIWKTEQNWN